MFNEILEILVSLFDSFICVYFITVFNRRTMRSCRLSVPALLVIFGITLAGDRFLPGFNVLSTALLFSVTVVYACLICEKHYIRAILSACIYKIVFILLSSLLYIVISSVVRDFAAIMQGSSGVPRLIYIILHKILLVSVLKLFLYVFNGEGISDIKTGIMTLLISLATVVGLGATMSLPVYSSDEYLTDVTILVWVFVVINVGSYILVSQVQKLQRNKYELKLLQEKLKFREERYNDTVSARDDIRRVHHDIKQHLTVISGQLDDNKIDDCRNYVYSLIPNIEQIGRKIRSDNSILEYIINSKLGSLTDVDVEISGSVGDLSDISEPDLACLMGNILDNAVEAVMPLNDKRIELHFYRQNSNRVIVCKNTVGAAVLENNKDLVSTKKEPERHGYGHLIIERIVRDNNGMIDYFEDHGMFGVQIVFPTEDN